MSDKTNLPPIIIKRVKKVQGGAHHGGSWKVAYADFVTAMMAFFLLLWLLNATTDEQKSGIADYFTPQTASFSRSGAGGVGGGITISLDGAKSSDSDIEIQEEIDPEDANESALQIDLAHQEEISFADTKLTLEEALQTTKELEDFSEHLKIDVTEEGLRIQIVDQEGRSMFRSGSAVIQPRMRELLISIAKIIAPLPNIIAISGHTDSSPFRNKTNSTNWELSSQRATASLQVLANSRIDPDKFVEVIGRADTDPLTMEDPFQPQNRRVSILLKRAIPVLPPELNKDTDFYKTQKLDAVKSF